MNAPLVFQGTCRMTDDRGYRFVFRSFIDNKYGEVFLYPVDKSPDMVRLEMELMINPQIKKEVFSVLGNKMRLWTEDDGTIEIPVEVLDLMMERKSHSSRRVGGI